MTISVFTNSLTFLPKCDQNDHRLHGHYTTAPKALEAWRNRQIAGINDRLRRPRSPSSTISDDELRRSIETNQLRLMKERGSDLTIFSPARELHGPPHRRFRHRSTWAAICNELCSRVSTLFPDNFIGAAMLPQSPASTRRPASPSSRNASCDYGFVAINLNPDPSGGHWTSPAAHRPPLVADLREDGRIRHPRDGACLDQLQPLLPHHRRPLHQRRHDRGDAVHPGRPVQGLSLHFASSFRTAAARPPITGAAIAGSRRN